MKLKIKIAHWLRKLANKLDPQFPYDDLLIPQFFNHSTHDIVTIQSLQTYPLTMVEKCPNLDNVAKRDIARMMAEMIIQGSFIEISKSVNGGEIKYMGTLKAAKPDSI